MLHSSQITRTQDKGLVELRKVPDDHGSTTRTLRPIHRARDHPQLLEYSLGGEEVVQTSDCHTRGNLPRGKETSYSQCSLQHHVSESADLIILLDIQCRLHCSSDALAKLRSFQWSSSLVRFEGSIAPPKSPWVLAPACTCPISSNTSCRLKIS